MFNFKQTAHADGALKMKSVIAIMIATVILATSFVGIAFYTNAAYITDGNDTQFVFAGSDDALEILSENGYTVGEFDQVSVTNTLSNILNINVIRAVPVTIQDNAGVKEYMTVKETVGEFLESIELSLGALDETDFNLDDKIESDMLLKINYAPTISVTADGKTSQYTVPCGYTVAKTLDYLGITLGKDDIVEPDLDEDVYANTDIVVKRVKYVEKTTTKDIDYTTSTVKSASLKTGTKKVTTKGVKGTEEIVTKITYVDGVATAKEVVSKTVIKEPVNEVITVGTAPAVTPGTPTVSATHESITPKTVATSASWKKGSVVSPAPSSVTLDKNGIPVNYSRVMTGKTSAYSEGYGALCSRGQLAQIGLVAVNPNIIPYGTRMYIIANDGSVYGYAIAADTGGALMRGKVLIDLYMGPNNSSVCYQWGIRNATVYILD